ncbi:MAG: hypothetical protein ACOY3P_20190 [Planctomycetota bacterium]
MPETLPSRYRRGNPQFGKWNIWSTDSDYTTPTLFRFDPLNEESLGRIRDEARNQAAAMNRAAYGAPQRSVSDTLRHGAIDYSPHVAPPSASAALQPQAITAPGYTATRPARSDLDVLPRAQQYPPAAGSMQVPAAPQHALDVDKLPPVAEMAQPRAPQLRTMEYSQPSATDALLGRSVTSGPANMGNMPPGAFYATGARPAMPPAPQSPLPSASQLLAGVTTPPAAQTPIIPIGSAPYAEPAPRPTFLDTPRSSNPRDEAKREAFWTRPIDPAVSAWGDARVAEIQRRADAEAAPRRAAGQQEIAAYRGHRQPGMNTPGSQAGLDPTSESYPQDAHRLAQRTASELLQPNVRVPGGQDALARQDAARAAAQAQEGLRQGLQDSARQFDRETPFGSVVASNPNASRNEYGEGVSVQPMDWEDWKAAQARQMADIAAGRAPEYVPPWRGPSGRPRVKSTTELLAERNPEAYERIVSKDQQRYADAATDQKLREQRVRARGMGMSPVDMVIQDTLASGGALTPDQQNYRQSQAMQALLRDPQTAPAMLGYLANQTQTAAHERMAGAEIGSRERMHSTPSGDVQYRTDADKSMAGDEIQTRRDIAQGQTDVEREKIAADLQISADQIQAEAQARGEAMTHDQAMQQARLEHERAEAEKAREHEKGMIPKGMAMRAVESPTTAPDDARRILEDEGVLPKPTFDTKGWATDPDKPGQIQVRVPGSLWGHNNEYRPTDLFQPDPKDPNVFYDQAGRKYRRMVSENGYILEPA